ncbi:MAG: hypothetical protein D6725_14830 [Planctomycetota bacterium]|nr:MAG: hypothetical protein D6725_14830 [Planctomycetota bacterium]
MPTEPLLWSVGRCRLGPLGMQTGKPMRREWRSVRRGFISGAVVCALIAVGTGPANAASPDDPPIRAAVERAVRYLTSQSLEQMQSDHYGLVAYACLKGGRTPKDPFVAKLLDAIAKRVNGGKYHPTLHFYYEAACDAMALEAADPVKYKPHLQAIADYLMEAQRQGGQWDYPGQENGGDTSITQYGLLGLWACARAGVKIPQEVWVKAAQWQAASQKRDGGFAYHPRTDQATTHSMTTAGTGNLCIVFHQLFPGQGLGLGGKSETKKPAKPKQEKQKDPFGGRLKKMDFDRQIEKLAKQAETVQKPAQDDGDDKTPVNLRGARTAILNGVRGGLTWLLRRYTIAQPSGWKLYYLYALERLMALTNLKTLGPHDWYADGSQYLLTSQKPDGSWEGTYTQQSATAFAVLFLTRATSKIVKHAEPEQLGAGLLAGGRGLPSDLSKAIGADGSIRKDPPKKIDDPLDKLLEGLASADLDDIEATQQAIVRTVQLGNREELIGQKELLKQLAEDPRVEVRRTAVWALGRCEDLSVVPVLLKALEDPDLDVVVEARNALCVLARRPRGLGLPDHPDDTLPPTATQAEREQARKKWQAELVKRWREWYLRIRPYDERDDVLELTVRKR